MKNERKTSFPKSSIIHSCMAVVALVAGCSQEANTSGEGVAATTSSSEARRAEFLDNGEIKRPENWRSWIFMGANVTPNGLNNGKAFFPEFHFSYIEPSAWAYYQRTGEFANGTQIVKELVLTEVGEHEDGSTTKAVGRGYYAGTPIVLALEYKDTDLFPDNPGGWAFYDFGQGQPYKASGAAHPYENCAACHEQAKKTDYVFVENYPVMVERDSDYAPTIRQ